MLYTNQQNKQHLGSALVRELSTANSLDIAVGYLGSSFSEDLESKILDLSSKCRVRMMLGMYFHAGMTAKTFDRAEKMDRLIRANGIEDSGVYISRKEYHGKIYKVDHDMGNGKIFVGSSNLSPSGLEKRLECNIAIDQSDTNFGGLASYLDFLFSKEISVNLAEVEFRKSQRAPQASSLEDYKISATEFQAFKQNVIGTCSVKLRPDSQPNSSLNLFFDNGRKNKDGKYQPRPWYEVELTTQAFERRDPFFPVTKPSAKKDGGKNRKGYFHGVFEFRNKYFRIPMVASGDGGKDIMSRSPGGRQLLGEFIKGSFEDLGVLKENERITGITLDEAAIEKLTIGKVSNEDYVLELS